MLKPITILSLIILLTISLVSASSFGYDNPNLPKLNTPATTTTTTSSSNASTFDKTNIAYTNESNTFVNGQIISGLTPLTLKNNDEIKLAISSYNFAPLPTIDFNSATGTEASPDLTAFANYLGILNFNGNNGVGEVTGAEFYCQAYENWNDTARGTTCFVSGAKKNTNTVTDWVQFNEGNLNMLNGGNVTGANLCYSNGTNCQGTSSFDKTNIAYLNETSIFTNNVTALNLFARNICYSNGTGCQAGSNFDKTNIAYTNESNNFSVQQNINSNLNVTGNVGIGTGTPRRQLDVLNGDGSTPQMRLSYSDNNKYVDFRTTSGGNLVVSPVGGFASFGSASISTSSYISIGSSPAGADGNGFFASQNYPVISALRDTTTLSTGYPASVLFQRNMTVNASNNSGIGIYMATTNNATSIINSGLFGAGLYDVRKGLEKGEMIFSSAWGNDGNLFTRRQLVLQALTTDSANLSLNGTFSSTQSISTAQNISATDSIFATKKINIGNTANPVRLLTVSGNTATAYQTITSSDSGTAGILLGGQSADYNGRIVYDNNLNALSLWSNNGQSLTINSVRNVGIGTVTPNQKLEVAGTINATSYYGDGSNLTNMPKSNFTKTNVAYLNETQSWGVSAVQNFTNTNITGMLNVSQNVTAFAFIGSGAYLSNMPMVNSSYYRTTNPSNFQNNSYPTSATYNRTEINNNLSLRYSATNPSGFINISSTYSCPLNQVIQNITVNSSGVFGKCITMTGGSFDKTNVAYTNTTNSGNFSITGSFSSTNFGAGVGTACIDNGGNIYKAAAGSVCPLS